MGFFTDFLEEQKRKLKKLGDKYVLGGVDAGIARLRQSFKSPSIYNILSPTAQRTATRPGGTIDYLKNRIKNPIARTALNYSRNLINTSTAGTQSLGKGYQHLIKREYPQAAGNLAKGAGQWGSLIIPAARKIHSFANLLSSFDKPVDKNDLIRRSAAGVLGGQTQIPDIAPNVPDRTTKTPFGDIDLVKAGGSMYGFINNPVNKGLFRLTNKFMPTSSKTVTKWLTTTSIRGSLENILLSFADMPTDLSEGEKVSYMAKNGLLGAVQEIGGQLIAGGIGKVAGSKPIKWTRAEVANLFDTIKNGARKWNVPTSKIVNNKRVTQPMWKQYLSEISKDQSGFIKPDEFLPKSVKELLEKRFDPKVKSAKDVTSGVMASRYKFDEVFIKRLQKSYTDPEINSAMSYVRDSGKPVANAEGYVIDALKTKIYTREPVTPKAGARRGEPNLSPEEVFRANQNAAEYKAEFEPKKTVKKTIKEKIVEPSGNRLNDFKKQMPQDVTGMKPDEASGVFQFGRDYGKSWVEDIRSKALKAGIDAEKFGQIARGEIAMTPQARKLHTEYLQASRAILEYSGAKTRIKEDWGMPHIWEEDLKLQEFLPNTFIDQMNSEFGNILPRAKNATGYIGDPFKALDNYWERALVHKFRPAIEAKRRGIPLEAVEAEISLAKELGKASIEGKLKDVNLIDRIKDILKKSKTKVKIKIIKTKLSGLERGGFDSWRNLKELGIYDHFRPLDNARTFANVLLEEQIRPLLKAGQFDKAALLLTKINKEVDSQSLSSYLKSRASSGVEVEKLLDKITIRAFENRGMRVLTKFLGETKFENLETQAYVNDVAKSLMTRGIVAKNTLTRILRFTRGAWYHGALGLNIRSGINNMFETKRLWALTDGKTVSSSYKKAFSEGDAILEKYSVTSKVLEDELDVKFGKGTSQKLLEKGSDTLMFMFNKSEALKDKVFLHAFEMKADELGLKGFEKTKYVIDNFQKYAHKYGKLGTIGLFKGEIAKTALQFNQYGMKDIGLTVDMVRQTGGVKQLLKGDLTSSQKQAWKYLTKMAIANLTLTTITGALYGARWEEIWGNLPTELEETSPTSKLIYSIFEASKEFKDQLEAGDDPDWNKIMTGKLKRQLYTLIPAGNQLINKTGAFLTDAKRGYSETDAGNVRYPTPLGLGSKIIGTTMGRYATKEARRYWDENLRPLGSSQSDDYRDFQAIDPQSARDEYERIIQNRESAKQERVSDDRLIESILTGKPLAGKPSSPKDQLVSTVLASGQASQTTQAPRTIYDIIAKDKAEKDTRSLIEDVLIDDDGKFTEMSEAQKQQYLSMKGITEVDIKDYEFYKFKNAPIKDKASLIMQQGQPDFVALFKAEVLTLEVLKELQRRGFIANAKDLWDKIKLSDPYIRQEAIRDSTLKYQKGILKTRAETQKSLLKARATGISKMLKTAAYTPRLKRSRTRYTVSRPSSMKLATPKPYKLDKVVVNF